MIHSYPAVFGPLISSDPIFILLDTLYKYQVSKLIFKCINKIEPVKFRNWFKINHEMRGYSTRSNINVNDDIKIKNIFIPSVRTTNYGLKQLKVNGPRIWNALPTNIKNITSLHAHYISEYG